MSQLVTISDLSVNHRSKIDLRSLTFEQLEDHLPRWQVPSQHAHRIFRGIHRLQQNLNEIQSLGRHAQRISQYAQIQAIQLIQHTRVC